MALADRTPERVIPGRTCSVCFLRDQAEPSEQAVLTKWLKDPMIQAVWIAEQLSDEYNVSIDGNTVARCRRKHVG